METTGGKESGISFEYWGSGEVWGFFLGNLGIYGEGFKYYLEWSICINLVGC